MKKNLYVGMFALALLFAQSAQAQTGSVDTSMTVCTMEAKICPDGSSVGRQGPNCEFAPCPAGVRTSPPTRAYPKASTTQAQIKEDRKEFKEETKEKRENFREDSKEKRELAKLQAMVRIVINRLNATIIRLERIVAKLDTRIAKFREKGADVTVATKTSADAKISLADARIKLNAIVIPTSIATSTATTTKESMKSSIKEIESIIKKAHKAVEEALKSFKGMSVKATTTATASTTITN